MFLNTMWRWQNAHLPDGSIIVANDPARYTLQFDGEGRYTARANCKNVSGLYALEGDSLSLLPDGSIFDTCPDELQDPIYLDLLSSVTLYALTVTDELLLETDTGIVLSFRPEPTIVGIRWALIRTADATGVEKAITASDHYTIRFNENARFSFYADCNRGSGTYTQGDNNSLRLTVEATTRAICPAGSFSETYIRLLNAVIRVSMTDMWMILTTADGETLVFLAT